MSEATKKTIFVAVHGIGDQVRNESIQAVAQRVYEHFAQDQAAPALGAFLTDGKAAYLPGVRTRELGDLGFAEVYWADLTRGPATEGYTLEEAKRWATTVVERMRARRPTGKAIDYDLVQQVLGELIETIAVTDRLVGLARKANLGSFDLKRILDQFLGDVQFFTDFVPYRSQIVGCFHQALEKIHDEHPEADIVLVAHSEGTVVAFTGLLLAATGKTADGANAATPAGWLPQVRALMTIGSPIDKHLVLWPEIWEQIEAPKHLPPKPIVWRNYYDHGDPVGFELDTARRWLRQQHDRPGRRAGRDPAQVPGRFLLPAPAEQEPKQEQSPDLVQPPELVQQPEQEPAGGAAPPPSLFEFEKDHDHGFSRYLFPGKAHVDYWADKRLFGHFLDVLVKGASERQLRTKALSVLISYLLPYLASFAVLFLAVYALSKGANEAGFVEKITPENLFGYTALLAGVTLLARVPRLVRKWWRWLVGGGAMALGAFTYHELVTPKLALPYDFLDWLPLDHFVLVGILVAVVSIVLGRAKTMSGMKPLVISGSVAALLLVVLGAVVPEAPDPQAATEAPARQAATEAVGEQDATEAAAEPEKPFWPILVGAAFFLYLWWFAALLFDLVFVWHRNIRHSAFID